MPTQQSTNRRKPKRLAVLVAVVVVFAACWYWITYRLTFQGRFDSIGVGTTRERVYELLGPPGSVPINRPIVVTSFVFYSPSPGSPMGEVWANEYGCFEIWFDVNGHVAWTNQTRWSHPRWLLDDVKDFFRSVFSSPPPPPLPPVRFPSTSPTTAAQESSDP